MRVDDQNALRLVVCCCGETVSGVLLAAPAPHRKMLSPFPCCIAVPCYCGVFDIHY